MTSAGLLLVSASFCGRACNLSPYISDILRVRQSNSVMSKVSRSLRWAGARPTNSFVPTCITLPAPTSVQRSIHHSIKRASPSAVRAAAATLTRSPSSECPARRIDVDPDVIYEYSSQSNPAIPGVPIRVLKAEHHQSGPSHVTPFDLSSDLGTPYPATSPNLLTSFIRILRGEQLTTTARATSQGFYVIRGQGRTVMHEEGGEDRTMGWKQGDIFVVPYSAQQSLVHHCDDVEIEHGGAALYWIHDEPLLRYLGVAPTEAEFTASKFTNQYLVDKVQELRHDPNSSSRNRLGILIANADTTKETKTLTHVLWSLLNVLPAHTTQPPHRHNSVAIDLCISASPGAYVNTAMSQCLHSDGTLVDPQRVQWESGAAFVTPPGWWHLHENKAKEDAWVLPLQDAGLLTHQRILDIRFAPDEVKQHKKGMIWGISLNAHVAVVGCGAN